MSKDTNKSGPPPVPLRPGWHVIEVTKGKKRWYEVRKGGGSWLVVSWADGGGAIEYKSLFRARRSRDKQNRRDVEREGMTERRVR